MILETSAGTINTKLIFHIDTFEEHTQSLSGVSCSNYYKGGLIINGIKLYMYNASNEERANKYLKEAKELKNNIVMAMENDYANTRRD